MSDGAPKRRLLLDRSNVNVDVHCLVVYMVRDGVGYFTGLSINCDDVTDGNDGFCWNRNRAVVTKLETIKMVRSNGNINFGGDRHGITSFRRRGDASKTGGVPAGSWS